MKKILCILLSIFILCSCQKTDLIAMTSVNTEEYRAIEWANRVYVPYSPADKTDMGKQIGIVDNDKNDCVYEAEGLPAEEWIMSYYKSGEMDSPVLMKEKNVTDIPEGFTSEYEWNK